MLQRQLASDCQLLRECGVMDYSLLLGVHYPARTGCKLSMEHAVSMDTATAAAAAVTAVANTDKAAGNAGGGAGMHSQHLRSALAALSEPPPTLSSHLRRTSDSDGELGPLPPLGPWAAARSGSGSAAAGGLPLFLASERVTSEDVAGAGFGAGGGVGGGPAGDRARNFELHSAAAEDEEQLSVIQQRMQRLGFSEQRMKVCAGKGYAAVPRQLQLFCRCLMLRGGRARLGSCQYPRCAELCSSLCASHSRTLVLAPPPSIFTGHCRARAAEDPGRQAQEERGAQGATRQGAGSDAAPAAGGLRSE